MYINTLAFDDYRVISCWKKLAAKFYNINTESIELKIKHLMKMKKIKDELMINFANIQDISDIDVKYRDESALLLKLLKAEFHIRQNPTFLKEYREHKTNLYK